MHLCVLTHDQTLPLERRALLYLVSWPKLAVFDVGARADPDIVAENDVFKPGTIVSRAKVDLLFVNRAKVPDDTARQLGAASNDTVPTDNRLFQAGPLADFAAIVDLAVGHRRRGCRRLGQRLDQPAVDVPVAGEGVGADEVFRIGRDLAALDGRNGWGFGDDDLAVPRAVLRIGQWARGRLGEGGSERLGIGRA